MGRLIFLLINRIKKKYIRQVWNFSILVWIFLQEEVPSIEKQKNYYLCQVVIEIKILHDI